VSDLGEIQPSPTKQNQIKMLGFTWFYSSESGLFNGLPPIPNKKIRASYRPAGRR
jgi:hypothetical protein